MLDSHAGVQIMHMIFYSIMQIYSYFNLSVRIHCELQYVILGTLQCKPDYQLAIEKLVLETSDHVFVLF